MENYQLEAEIATRTFLMNDCKKGRHVIWDVDKAIANHTELRQMLGIQNMIKEQHKFEVSFSDEIGNTNDGRV